MELEKIRENEIIFSGSNYSFTLECAYEFIKSKGLESAYKAQCSNREKAIIEHFDYIKELTNL